jgi:hypothetical protein
MTTLYILNTNQELVAEATVSVEQLQNLNLDASISLFGNEGIQLHGDFYAYTDEEFDYGASDGHPYYFATATNAGLNEFSVIAI